MNLADAIASRAAAFTVTEAASLLDVDVRTVSRACDDGQLPSLRIGRRLLIPRLPLLALLGVDPNKSEAGAPTPAQALTVDDSPPGGRHDHTTAGSALSVAS